MLQDGKVLNGCDELNKEGSEGENINARNPDYATITEVDKIFRIVDSLESADSESRKDDALLTTEQRFAAFMELMEPYYAASEGFQRILRIDDAKQRKIHDDWGIRVQFVQKP